MGLRLEDFFNDAEFHHRLKCGVAGGLPGLWWPGLRCYYGIRTGTTRGAPRHSISAWPLRAPSSPRCASFPSSSFFSFLFFCSGCCWANSIVATVCCAIRLFLLLSKTVQSLRFAVSTDPSLPRSGHFQVLGALSEEEATRALGVALPVLPRACGLHLIGHLLKRC